MAALDGDAVGHDLVRGSAPVMTTKDLLLEVYHDMKFVRPAVEGLLAAGLVGRVDLLERDGDRRAAVGLTADLVGRVDAIEDRHEEIDARGVERRRLGDLSARTLGAIVIASNFLLGIVVLLVNSAKGA
jgi:hypothetical protein